MAFLTASCSRIQELKCLNRMHSLLKSVDRDQLASQKPADVHPHWFPLCMKNLQLKELELWLSGRVLDSRPRGRGVEPHRLHCVVVLEQDTFIQAKYWFNPGRPISVQLKNC